MLNILKLHLFSRLVLPFLYFFYIFANCIRANARTRTKIYIFTILKIYYYKGLHQIQQMLSLTALININTNIIKNIKDMKNLLQKTHLRVLMLVALLCAGFNSAWGETVTYTISSRNTLTTTGTAPSGSSATIVETYSTSKQMTKGNNQTLTLSGYSGYRITNITLSMKSNASGGSGYLEYADNSSTFTSIVPTAQFKSNSWYGEWSTSYVDVSKDVNLEPTSDNFIIRLGATVNSLYCESYTLTYENLSSTEVTTTTTAIDATGITNTDVYTGTAAGKLTATVTAGNDVISGATITWSGNNDDVATIDNDGNVTLVAPGTVTFTASYSGVENQYKPSSDTYEMTVTSSAPYVQPMTVDIIPNYTFWGKDAQFSGNANDNLSGSQENISLAWSRGNGSTYASTSAMRFYKDNTLTFTAPEGFIIKSIVLTMSTSQTDLSFNPTGYDTNNTTWTGSSETVVMSRPSSASNYAQITKFSITLGKVSSVKTPVVSLASGNYFEAQNVTISCETEGATIKYSTDGETWKDYTSALTINTTITLYAKAIKDEEESAVASAEYKVVITEGKGTETNPFTVADANKILTANITPEKVYVKGLVSQIDNINTTQYYNATYYISDDGSTNHQFYVYRGKNIDDSNFTSEEQLQKGDEVVIYGDLTIYGSDNVFEFKQGNYIVSIVHPVKPAAPIIFHDEGEYEGPLEIAIVGQGTIKYKLNDGAEQTYSAPINVSETTTITAWTESNGVKSDEVSKTFTIAAATAGPSVEDNYYTIKNNGNNKYVNIAGRKTVTFVDETATAAGTVIRVKADDKGQVQILRSQGVDIPGYAEKAMNYVPKIVELIVDKLHAEGSGELLGENGLDAIMAKFKESFDYHLYLEEANGGYRIYGRTPSMQPVVDFYAENKANVDAKLPGLEAFINSAIEKVLQKTNGSGASILVPFSLQTVWEKMGSTLTEPVDEASTAKFYEEVLSSEANVWNFAYETAMIYWTKLKEHPKFQDNLDKLGDYAKYIDKVENIRPNFKYYIVQKDNKLDFISQGNSELNAAFTTWTLAERTDFSVAFNLSQEKTVCPTKEEDPATSYTEYYTTLNTDFAYNVPEGVIAYQITGIGEIKGNMTMGTVLKKKLNGTVPAQTPVLLVATEETAQLELTEDIDALSNNELYGNDYLIVKDQLKHTMIKTLFETIKDNFGESFYNTYVAEYEHLELLNSGTVNNKYFFNLSKDNDLAASNSYSAGKVMVLGQDDDLGIRFHYASQEDLIGNEAFMIDESNQLEDIVLSLKGDVNRDGKVDVADITALVNIILNKATYPKDVEFYDFDAANVNGDELISIPDLTALVNIILNSKKD